MSVFISSLLTDGKITVEGSFSPIDSQDRQLAIQLLHDFYRRELLEMPLTAPAFEENAALWAAEYLFTAIRLTVDREADEQKIKESLKHYPGAITPEAIFSADLVLRQLPLLMNLVKGLAPSDFLLKELLQTAADWPFSSAGYKLEKVNHEDIVLGHPSLRVSYLDRIIHTRDKSRASAPLINEQIMAIAGDHLELIWPGLELIKNGNDE